MKKYSNTHEEKGEVDLNVKFNVVDGALFFRELLCSTTLKNGMKVDIDTNSDGSILVVLTTPEKDGGWRTYALKPENLVRAVLKAENIE